MKTFKYGFNSKARLYTCHPELIRMAFRAITISPVDITIVCGARDKFHQNLWLENRTSKKRWPNSKHNAGEGALREKSDALDFAPWIKGRIPWGDEGAFYGMALVFGAAAKIEGIEIRPGSDWDRDGLTEDQTFMDLGHIERISP